MEIRFVHESLFTERLLVDGEHQAKRPIVIVRDVAGVPIGKRILGREWLSVRCLMRPAGIATAG
jgi:hypothetical protein